MSKAILGIDVSKNDLSLCLLLGKNSHQKKVSNDLKGFTTLKAWVESKNVINLLVCLEATGHYGEKVADFLYSHHYQVSIVNPVRIKAFARSKLSRHKTDEVDACLIAEFASKTDLKLYQPREPVVKELRAYYRCMQNLKAQQKQLGDFLENRDYLPQEIISTYERLSTQINQEILALEALSDTLIATHEALRQDVENLKSIPGIGKITALAMLVEIPDRTQFKNARQLAAYAGLTPSQRTSGTSLKGKARLSKIGSAILRKALYFPAIVAKNHNPVLKTFAANLKLKGKHTMVIIGAVMRKLLHIIFGILKNKTAFNQSH